MQISPGYQKSHFTAKSEQTVSLSEKSNETPDFYELNGDINQLRYPANYNGKYYYYIFKRFPSFKPRSNIIASYFGFIKADAKTNSNSYNLFNKYLFSTSSSISKLLLLLWILKTLLNILGKNFFFCLLKFLIKFLKLNFILVLVMGER